MSDEILDLKFYNNVLYALSPAQEEMAKLEFCFVDRKKSYNPGSVSKMTEYLKGVTAEHNLTVQELEGKFY